jgi:hypothetical protein
MRFRSWLGRRFGGDAALGNRIERRAVHAIGAAALLYYILPSPLFGVLPKEEILLGALAAVLLLEVLRHAVGLPLPLLRDYEEHRVAGFAFFAIALVAVLLLAPRPVAAAVILGTAVVDPVTGELRAQAPRLYPAVPLVLYGALATIGLAGIGGWPLVPSIGLAAVAAVVAVAAEAPKYRWLDDDLVMTFVPALALWGLGAVLLGLGG